MVADDHLIFLESMSMLINSMDGVELIGLASNGNEAMEAISREKPHILLCDQDMPVLSGLEVTIRVKKLYPEVRIIMLTMHVDSETVMHGLKAGVSGILSKNISRIELLEAIKTVMSGQQYFSRDVELSGFDDTKFPLAEPLTNREKEILESMQRGLSYKMIAQNCGVSYFTVNSHIKHIYKKLGVNSSTAALSKALKLRLITS